MELNLTTLDFWIIAAGILCAMACALVGSFLVLRKMSMMGDAISHAVLPGLAVAFFLTESRASLPMFIGAAVVGVLTAVFTEWIRGYGKVDEGASMGVVFTALFAIGLIMIVQAADHVDLDPGCVLYGAIEMTPLDTVSLSGSDQGPVLAILGHEVLDFSRVPRAVVVLSIVLLINIAAVLLFYKELKISSFDPGLATTLGISARWMHYLLMTLVAITTVASFEAVGSILVVAMLIVPPAAAYMLTDRLWLMLLLSLALAALSAIFGHLGAIIVPKFFGYSSTSTAGMMAVVAGVLLGVAVLFSPRYGLVSKVLHQVLLSLRIVREDILGMLYRSEEQTQRAGEQAQPVTLRPSQLRRAILAGPLLSGIAMTWLRWRGLVAREAEGYHLTDNGRRHASDLLRSHRLWETYFARHVGVADDHVHQSADRLEHVPHMADRLDEQLDHPDRDPHDDAIPRPHQP